MRNWWRWLSADNLTLAQTGSNDSIGKYEEFGSLPAPTADSIDVRRWVSLFLWLGVLARAIRYYLCFPLWDDESFLCVNLIHRTYSELLQPLDYHQVAPVLFLWVERTAVRLLGFSEYSLRLLPFACSIASLFLFRRIAERLLCGQSLLFAVAIFAVSYPGIRYAAEAKPYGTDLFVSLVMLWRVVEWRRRRGTGDFWLLTALMPVALGISYPSVFFAGGMSLVVAAVLLWERGTTREWTAWSIWNLSVVTSFVVWFHLVGRIQGAAEGEFMGEYWKLSFPPIAQPWLVPYWLLKTHASDFLAYPVGGPKWASTGTLILCVAGLWQLIERRQIFTLLLVICPASLHFVAAALQKYPYGGHVKFSQYLAPVICCLAAAGAAQILLWFSRRENSAQTRLGREGEAPAEPRSWYTHRLSGSAGASPGFAHKGGQTPATYGRNESHAQRVGGQTPFMGKASPSQSLGLVLGSAICLIIGCIAIGRDLANPYKTRSDFRARAFAESFWPGVHLAEEVACMKSDLGLDFVPDQHRELSWSAHYLCNRAIEISRSSLRPADFNRVSATRPLRCVLYRDARYTVDETGLNDWLRDMQQNFELVAHETLPFARMAKDDRKLITMEYVESYKFVPRGTSLNQAPPLADAPKPPLR